MDDNDDDGDDGDVQGSEGSVPGSPAAEGAFGSLGREKARAVARTIAQVNMYYYERNQILYHVP